MTSMSPRILGSMIASPLAPNMPARPHFRLPPIRLLVPIPACPQYVCSSPSPPITGSGPTLASLILRAACSGTNVGPPRSGSCGRCAATQRRRQPPAVPPGAAAAAKVGWRPRPARWIPPGRERAAATGGSGRGRLQCCGGRGWHSCRSLRCCADGPGLRRARRRRQGGSLRLRGLRTAGIRGGRWGPGVMTWRWRPDPGLSA